MNHDLIQKLTLIVQENLENENFGPDQLAHKMGVSHSTLHRWLKQYSNKNISQFIREIRLKKASEMILHEEFTISEIAYKVGFGSATYFNKCFREYFGSSPGEYRKKEKESRTELLGAKKNIQKVLIFIIPFMLVALIFLTLKDKYFQFRDNPSEKTLAILPVKYIGEPNYKYQAEGIWEEIKDNLAKIKDLRVLDRSSVEQYHLSNKSEKQIAKDLNVSFLLKITFQREDQKVIVSINLLKPEDGTILFIANYPRTLDDRFSLPNTIAQTVASEIQAKITPEEKIRIEKPLTINITAHDFYWRGRNEYQKYQLDNGNKKVLEKAEKNYKIALDYDSSFALAYAGLAQIYFDKNYWKEFFKETFLDSVLILADKALLLDNQLAEAYYIKARYFQINGDFTQAIEEYNRAIEFNPNLWEAYFNKGRLYLFDAQEIDQALLNLYLAATLHRGYSLSYIYENIGQAYNWIGLFKQRNNFYAKAFKLTGDSTLFYSNKAASERINKNLKKAVEWRTKAYHYNTNHLFNLKQLAFLLTETEQYKESLKYYKILWDRYEPLEKIPSKISLNDIHRIGYAYWKNGFEDEAAIFFDLQKRHCEKQIELFRTETKHKYVYYDLAAVYAFKGKKEKALKYLKIFNQRKTMPYWAVGIIKSDPLFDNIRNEPEFQQIVTEVEAKYLSEHKRVQQYLEEQGLLKSDY